MEPLQLIEEPHRTNMNRTIPEVGKIVLQNVNLLSQNKSFANK